MYIIKLCNQCLKPVFEFKIIFWICVLVLWIYKGYCVVKKLVWNVCIKAFWYTKLVSTNVNFYFVSFQKFWVIYMNLKNTNSCNFLKLHLKNNIHLPTLSTNFYWVSIEKKIYPQRPRFVLCLTLSLSSISYDYLIV